MEYMVIWLYGTNDMNPDLITREYVYNIKLAVNGAIETDLNLLILE